MEYYIINHLIQIEKSDIDYLFSYLYQISHSTVNVMN